MKVYWHHPFCWLCCACRRLQQGSRNSQWGHCSVQQQFMKLASILASVPRWSVFPCVNEDLYSLYNSIRFSWLLLFFFFSFPFSFHFSLCVEGKEKHCHVDLLFHFFPKYLHAFSTGGKALLLSDKSGISHSSLNFTLLSSQSHLSKAQVQV